MATRTPKKLAQTTLSTSMTAVYTAPSGTVTQITEIWVSNTNTTSARKISIAAHGTATANVLIPVQEIAENGYATFSDSKIVLAAGEVLAGKVDTGTDVNITVYGIEEA